MYVSKRVTVYRRDHGRFDVTDHVGGVGGVFARHVQMGAGSDDLGAKGGHQNPP